MGGPWVELLFACKLVGGPWVELLFACKLNNGKKKLTCICLRQRNIKNVLFLCVQRNSLSAFRLSQECECGVSVCASVPRKSGLKYVLVGSTVCANEIVLPHSQYYVGLMGTFQTLIIKSLREWFRHF